MFAINTIYAIFGVAAVIVFIVVFFAMRNFGKIRNFVVAVALFALAGVYFMFVNHVYVVTDDNQVSEYGLIMTSDFELVNGTKVRIIPETKVDKSWLINNGNRLLKFETVIYGSTSKNPYGFQLEGYKSIGLDNSIDYLFTTPPNSVKTKSKSVTKGWLHR